MSLVEDIFRQPELVDQPPVLVDIGAAGGVHKPWRTIARHCVGVGFEPDSRDAAALTDAKRIFRRWVFVPGLAVPKSPAGGALPFHLTRSPQCSSVLRPDSAGLEPWAFAGLFEITATRDLSAVGLLDGLKKEGIERVDWLKCDTQGMDLRLLQSLPGEWRARTLAIEMEPGFIEAYEGEDHLSQVLEAMRAEPFWLARCDVQQTPRGRARELASALGDGFARRYAFYGAGAPGWANLTYLRDFDRVNEVLDRREHLLGWLFSRMVGQPAVSLSIAMHGIRRFDDGLFQRMAAASRAQLRRAFLSGWLRALPLRLLRR